MSRSEYDLIGKGIPLHDASQKAAGRIRYTDDIKLPHMLHAKVLWSPLPHARIVSIDTSEAEALPGVAAVATCRNSSTYVYNSCGEDINKYQTERLFDETVRFIGDRVAAVAAEDEATAEKALRLIRVEYEELPFYTDPEAAMQPEATPLHACGNVPQEVLIQAGDVEAAMAQADRVFEFTYNVPAIHHAAMEPHVSLADFDASGKLTVYTPSQDVFGIRTNLSRIFALPMSKVRVINPVMGGGFGGKIDLITEGVTAQLAILTGRPVKLTLNRRESIVSTRTRHAMKIRLRSGVMNDGTIIAEDAAVIANMGAYTSGSMSVVWATGGKWFKDQKTPNLRYHCYPVYTNTPIAGAMRGFGSPQRNFARQRQMNRIAKALNMSVLDLQLKNLVDPDATDPRDGKPHGNPHPKDAMRRGADLFGWDEAWAEQTASKKAGGRYRIGVGMAVGVHGNGVFGVMPDTTGVMIKVNEDGSLTFFTGVSDMGNGSVTTQQQIASEILGITLDRFTCITADTEATMWDLGNYSSRGTFVSGQAAAKAARQAATELKAYAAEMLACSPDDVILQNNQASSKTAGTAAVSLADVAAYAKRVHETDICVAETFASNSLAMSYGAHFCKVRVDTETGEVTPLLYAAVHDLGYVINPLHAKAQIAGGIQMGLGYALTEELAVGNDGKTANTTFKKYRLFHAHEMPEMRIEFIEAIEPSGPFGAKSIGECAVVPSGAAVANAISNALDIDFDALPIRPDAVRQARADG